jgi:hypothetical protein
MARKELFGIFSPILGEKRDFPTILLDKTIQTENMNIVRKYGEIHRRQMREPDMLDGSDAKSQTPDTNPIIHFHLFVKRSTAAQYLLAFTKAHIYLWNSAAKTWDLKFTCSADCTEWSTVTYNDKVIATNNVDMVLVWDTSGYFIPLQNTIATAITAATQANPCKITAAGHGLTNGDRVFIKDVVGMTQINNLQFIVTVVDVDNFTLNGVNSSAYTAYDSAGTVVEFEGIDYDGSHFVTKAKYVTTFENYLQLGYTYENGTSYPQRIRWCDIGDETDWASGDAGSAETEGADFIKGFKIYSGKLIIFKETSRIIQTLVSYSDVWNWVKMPGAIGCLSNHSIVEDPDGRVYWLANDLTFREMETGEISHAIDPIVKLIEPSSAYLVCGQFMDETGEIWWSIPYSNALNNKVITYKEGSWGELDIVTPAFGNYKEA